ncbi:hypothetical protein HOD08_00760 [bacterium]|nr:hypothetical protein [bacterium]
MKNDSIVGFVSIAILLGATCNSASEEDKNIDALHALDRALKSTSNILGIICTNLTKMPVEGASETRKIIVGVRKEISETIKKLSQEFKDNRNWVDLVKQYHDTPKNLAARSAEELTKQLGKYHVLTQMAIGLEKELRLPEEDFSL